jgi:hypothetical protein
MKKLCLWLTVGLGWVAAGTINVRADEQLFGFVRGAETLPKGQVDLYQFVTLRTGKDTGDYYGLDFDTEVEYGFTDKFQASLGLVQHYFNLKDVDGLDDGSFYRFGGVDLAGKYNLLSPFKDPVGLAFRLEGGYLINDEVGGLPQNEWYIAPELVLQKNFRDDTIICNLNLGAEWAWGKQPAEEYPREFSLQGATGVAYRFAPNWFLGVEGRVRSEWPMFDFNNFEHLVVFVGPSLHYSAQRWWVTLTWVYQVYGKEVDPTTSGRAYAEEAQQMARLKVGFNF